jgi:hypothetical protein
LALETAYLVMGEVWSACLRSRLCSTSIHRRQASLLRLLYSDRNREGRVKIRITIKDAKPNPPESWTTAQLAYFADMVAGKALLLTRLKWDDLQSIHERASVGLREYIPSPTERMSWQALIVELRYFVNKGQWNQVLSDCFKLGFPKRPEGL